MSEPTITIDDIVLPAGTITGHAGAVHADGYDPDPNPDLSAWEGVRVSFTPTVPLVILTTDDGPVMLEPRVETGRFVGGRLVLDLNPPEGGERQPLRLWASTGQAMVPPVWGWRPTLSGQALDPKIAKIKIPALALEPGATVDFADVISGSLPDVPANAYESLLAAVAELTTAVSAGSIVASAEVNRLVAVEVGQTPALEDGDLVVRYDRPGTHYFTDFTDTPIGEAPTNWEQPWNAFPGGPPTVQAIPDATGGTALVWGTGSGAGANRAVTVWNAIPDNDDSRDVELLVRLRTNVSGGMFPAIVSRVTGDNATGWAIRAGRHSPTTISISRYFDGTYGSSSTVPVPELEADTWYMMRYRGDGDIHSFKMWEETHDEPDWMQTTTNLANVNPGKVGFMFHGGAARVEIDWVAVASAGRRAAP